MKGLSPLVLMGLLGGMDIGRGTAPLPESCIRKPQTEEQKTLALNKAQEKRERRKLKAMKEHNEIKGGGKND